MAFCGNCGAKVDDGVRLNIVIYIVTTHGHCFT